jgi:hypothetical protein
MEGGGLFRGGDLSVSPHPAALRASTLPETGEGFRASCRGPGEQVHYSCGVREQKPDDKLDIINGDIAQ